MATKPGWDVLIFLLKVLGSSVAIAGVFKTVAPRLPIPATDGVGLAIVLTPAIVLGGFLTWRLL